MLGLVRAMVRQDVCKSKTWAANDKNLRGHDRCLLAFLDVSAATRALEGRSLAPCSSLCLVVSGAAA